jgi:hypothetical protein
MSTVGSMDAILINPDATTELFQFELDDDSIKKRLKGYVTVYPHPKGWRSDVTVFVDEEGIQKNLPPNPLAVFIMIHLGYKCSVSLDVVGPAIIVGYAYEGLTKEQVSMIQDLIKKF